jgi:hypothetical protein
MSLYGKGWFIWQVGRCEGGSPEAIADKAAAAGLTHVLLKVAERTFAYGFDRHGRDLVAPVAEALRQRGVGVWGWHYLHGDKPVDEARVAVQRAVQLNLDGYVLDAETEYRQPGRSAAARAFMSNLRSGLPGHVLVGLSSYRYPTLHPQLPWRAFLEHCDLVLPQVYWEQAHNPAQQLARSVGELTNPEVVGYVRPVVPTGAAYGSGGWRATPEDVVKFLAQAQKMGLAGANLYSWDYATSAGNTELWDAAAKFDWSTGAVDEPGANPVAAYMEALNSGDPQRVLSLYREDAGHVTAARTLVGREELAAWYDELLGQKLAGAVFATTQVTGHGTSHHFRWKAAGPTGEVVDGDDTIGLAEGRIQYHYTSFSFAAAPAHTLPHLAGRRKAAAVAAAPKRAKPAATGFWWWRSK